MPGDIVKFETADVRGFLHIPGEPCPGLVLTHGAGANCATPLLVAVANAFCAAGLFVLRFDLPFRQRRPFGPPHPSTAAADREGVRAALHVMRDHATGAVFAGGHSYGGRQATLLAAEDPNVCVGLLLLSYPLHPPGKPAQLRTAHFPSLAVPVLFLHGAADSFGTIDEMTDALALIPSRTKLVPLERAGHDLARGKFDMQSLIVEPFAELTGLL
jgi:uncharacterized protein